MANPIYEGKYPGEYIATEARGARSRDVSTLISGQNLKAGAVCGTITTSKKRTAVNPAANDGSEVASSILFANTDATGGDKKVTFTTRDCEVNQSELDFGSLNAGQIVTAIAQLATQGIIVRYAV